MAGNPKGKQGEDIACEFLIQNGYRVLDRNWHCRYGEIDIIARKGTYLCFVEVKTRKVQAMVNGAESVGHTKQKKIISSAYCYLENNQSLRTLQPRFDLAQVISSPTTPWVMDYIENAFDSSAYSNQK